MTVPLLILIPVALLAALKARDLWRRRSSYRGKYSVTLSGTLVENKSFRWVLTGR